jgi:hypothetical protein
MSQRKKWLCKKMTMLQQERIKTHKEPASICKLVDFFREKEVKSGRLLVVSLVENKMIRTNFATFLSFSSSLRVWLLIHTYIQSERN